MTALFERVDQTPRVETDGFEHLNNFIVFNNGRDVLVRGISSQESLTSNLIQCTRMPLSDSCRYYTMKVETLETDNFLMFGLTNKCLPGAPMWTVDRSVRYHSNDGGVFNGDLGIHTYHSYNEGDTVTCRLDYAGSDRSLINFLHNDCFVYRQWVNLPPDQLYATIGVSRGRGELTVGWPEPEKGDIPIKNDLPSNWFGWKGIGRDDEASTFVLTNIDSTTQREAFNVQCPLALTRDFSYFEVEILRKASTTESEGHGIGLVSGNCEAFVYPGWTTNSIGYHNDDGGLYVNGNKVTVVTDDDLTCKESDRMGCGAIFPHDVKDEDMREPILVLIYFTKNGQLSHKMRMRQPRGGFFPCIAFCHIGDEIRLDVKCEPPALTSDLYHVLTTCEACADYRCTEVFLLRDLTHNSATVRLDTDHDQAQLLQYRAEPLRNVGDAFHVSVTDFGVTTEIQMGVSTEGFKLEGEFLGSEPTSCGYMLKLGTVVSKDGMRAVTKWNPNENQIIGCYLDYIDDGGAVLCFTIDGRLIGRGVVARATGFNSALYASIVISAGPAEIKVNWSGILNSTTLQRKQRKAEDWLRSSVIRGQNFRLERRPSEGYAFAASAQDCLPLVIGSSMFSVRLLGGKELPAVGLSRATTDVNNVLGSDSGEICFHPTTRSTLSNNENRRVANAPEIRVGDTLQCVVVFSRPADRVEQKVIVIFAVNGVIFHECRLQASYGGLYPTVAFSSSGGEVEILSNKTILPIPDTIRDKWLKQRVDDTTDYVAISPVSVCEVLPNGDPRKVEKIEACVPPPVVSDTVVVYASYAFADRDNVARILNEMKRKRPVIKVETSLSRASLKDKMDAIKCADLLVLFLSKAFYNSHEMTTEYACIMGEPGVPVILCTTGPDSWPPSDLFSEVAGELSKVPRVTLKRDAGGVASTEPLEKHVDRVVREKQRKMTSLQDSDSSYSMFITSFCVII